MNSITSAVKNRNRTKVNYKSFQSKCNYVLGYDPTVQPTPYYEAFKQSMHNGKRIKSVSAPIWDEWQGDYYACVRVKFHDTDFEESVYLNDILKEPWGELYLRYQWKHKKQFNKDLKNMNKDILKAKRESINFVSIFRFRFFFFFLSKFFFGSDNAKILYIK